MKKYLFIFAAAATCMLVACSKEKELRAPEAETEETTASEFVRLPGWTYIGASNVESKASLTDDSTPVFKWNTGDKIALFTDNDGYLVSEALDASFNNEESATFGFEGTGINPHRSCFAVYPASLVSGCANPTTNSLAINLPASYTLAQVQDLVSPIPMVAANAQDQALAFKSICALLRITVKNVAWDAQSIKIRFPGKKVNGAFSLSSFVLGESGVAGVASSSEAEETITITDLNLNNTYAEQLVVNIPVPMGTYDYVVTGAYDASGLVINWINTPVKADGSTGEPLTWSPGRKSRRTLTADLPVFTVYAADASASTPHCYISSADRQTIVFAPGNLQARLDVCPTPTPKWSIDNNLGTADMWRFAPNQYEAIADDKPTAPDERADGAVVYSFNSMDNPKQGDWVDLFSWVGTDGDIANKEEAKQYGIAYHITSGSGSSYGKQTTGYALKNDWGKNEVHYNGSSYAQNAWHTPTKDDFNYVLNYRYEGETGSEGLSYSAVRAKLTISAEKTVYGLIIFPDNFSMPYSNPAITIVKAHVGGTNVWKLSSGGVENAKCSENPLTLAQWNKLEGAGCVFLPFTCSTYFNSTEHVVLTDNVGEGLYWTSSPFPNKKIPYYLAFNDIEVPADSQRYGSSTGNVTNLQVFMSSGWDRGIGCGVRLVRYVKPE